MKQHKLTVTLNKHGFIQELESKTFIKKSLMNRYIEDIKSGYIFNELDKEDLQYLIFDIKSNKIKINCICCNKKIKLEQTIKPDKSNIDKGLTTNFDIKGVNIQIRPQYGSKFDSDIYLLSICDDCINTKLNTGQLKVLSLNYL